MNASLTGKSQSWRGIGILVGMVLLGFCFISSLTLGVADINLSQVYQAIMASSESTDHLIIRTVRLPRSVTATIVGAAVAVAGAIMQGLTRNPLADPGILGINAGAALAVVMAVFLFDLSSLSAGAAFALIGAGITAIVVYFLGAASRGGLTPLNLAIAGAAITALVSSITTGILILSQSTLDQIRFWLAGSVAGRDLELVGQVFPFIAIGLVLAFLLGKQLTALSLGEDIAAGLGQNTAWIKASAGLSVVLLAGGSVAIAGPIGFVGLVVPHLVRFLVGLDYRWILPYAAIAGSIMLLIADILARLVLQPRELPVGLVLPLFGAPFFLYLIRTRIRR
ncbi:ABC-type transporter, integral membrane subunit [Thalassoporum mexicanum PCC 7367]|uniref:FecCD family ABC transporter permease n=1 Tax=Thalassoporum mexicanum TaxID=3457544 RepID=UPI00029FDD56|nr:iron ABC transporter permease [Pseudanabaena sp. PCC 7367]AFY71451.1 ABC-type transporter, integral membrane subunit [Pseudanabaena sp. PCC 7367]